MRILETSLPAPPTFLALSKSFLSFSLTAPLKTKQVTPPCGSQRKYRALTTFVSSVDGPWAVWQEHCSPAGLSQQWRVGIFSWRFLLLAHSITQGKLGTSAPAWDSQHRHWQSSKQLKASLVPNTLLPTHVILLSSVGCATVCPRLVFNLKTSGFMCFRKYLYLMV